MTLTQTNKCTLRDSVSLAARALSDGSRPSRGRDAPLERASEKPAWAVRSPAESRQYYADSDPHNVGYFSRPATSLIQMLLTTRNRRQQTRSQFEGVRDPPALLGEHTKRLTKRSSASIDGIHKQSKQAPALPDASVNSVVRAR